MESEPKTLLQPSTRQLPPAEPQTQHPPAAVKQRPVPTPVPGTAGSLPPLLVGGRLNKRYSITRIRGLTYSTYYDALDLICPACQTLHPAAPPDGLCSQCHTPLIPVLIHERSGRLGGTLSGDDVQRLLRFSADQTNILPHWNILQYQARTYAVVKHPGQWGVLVRGRRQRSLDESLAGAVQVGQALVYLHGHGFAHSAVGSASLESLIVTGGGMDVKLADLSACVALSSGDEQAIRAQINRDVVFLGNLLFYLATGKELSRSEIELAPPALRPFVERAMHGQYASVGDMLTDFELLPSTPLLSRSLKPSHGQATHPGRKHTRNEDAIVTFTFDKEQKGRSVPVSFYLVADGMGGHDAGDVASRTVNEVVTDWIIKTKVLPDLRKATRKLTTENVPAELLTRAIQQANEMLLRRGQAKSSDLGSTVTTALVIGSMATIASVGDSRTYLLRAGRLKQIT
ncbi:MAG: protein phosphatase 2C domain-containing protein, partial [Chloroflexota bacterium]|nr:protein phosphatase 2C domain-containing protein [Chloroflexota bacterium]